MEFSVVTRKAEMGRNRGKKLLRDDIFGRHSVSAEKLATFLETWASLAMAMPFSGSYARSLYWDVTSARLRDVSGWCRLSHQSIRDIKFWTGLSRYRLDGQPIFPQLARASIHTDAADMGYGCTINTCNMNQGVAGMRHHKGCGVE